MIMIDRTRSDQATVICIRARFPRTRRERGAAAVEMAIVMPLLLAMLIGIIDFSRIFNAELQLSQAAREGARLASLRPQPSPSGVISSTDETDIRSRAQGAAPNPAFGGPIDPNLITVIPPYCTTTPGETDVAVVRVDYIVNGILWMNGKTLSQTARMRCTG